MGKSNAMPSLDTLFGGTAVSEDQITVIDDALIDEFPGHPYRLYTGKRHTDLLESVKEFGVLTPVILRAEESGRYTLLSSYNRRHCNQLAGNSELPAVVRHNVSDGEAKLIITHSNRQRGLDELLPSEKAFAFQMELEGLKETRRELKKVQAIEVLENAANADEQEDSANLFKFEQIDFSRDQLAKNYGIASVDVYRYIRLTPKNIHVEGGKLNTVEFHNTPYSDLRLVKIDAETRAPLEGAIFKLFDEKRLEIGTYTTTAQGEIIVRKLPSGNYFLQEIKAPAGYLLDNTVRPIELIPGKTTTVEIKNMTLGSLRIIKVDADTGKPLYGATFLLYDVKDNLLGEYTTDQTGSISFNKNLKDGKYKIKEIKAPDGYVLDQTVRTVTVKEGTTTEVEVKNTPIRGQIQIVKKSADYNDITKLKKGALLEDAVFEIFDSKNVVVDRITTDSRGVVTSKDLPIGVYGIREITAPKHYILDDKVFYAEIKLHGDLVKFEVLNDSEELGVDVQKFGNYEAMPGDIIRYDFEKIGNTSTVPLDDFYWRDVLPTDAVRLNKIVTGTWNEHLTYEVLYKTNKRGWRTLEDGISAKTSDTLDCSRSALHLKTGEYITEFKFEFGTVQAGFTQVDAPYILCSVNGDLPNEYRFTNKTDVGGQREKEWVTAKDAWVTIIYAKPRGKLPQTGR